MEISKTPNPERRRRVALSASSAHRKLVAGDKETLRAVEIAALGFSPIDALHLACAESSGANVFLTTDDKLLRAAGRRSGDLKLAVRNPLAWLQKVDV